MKLILLLLSTCGLALPLLTPVAAASASIVAQAYLTVGCTGNAASTTYTADECMPAEEHGLSVKHFCTDQYHYEVDYSDAACANAIRIVRTRIGECHAGQMSQCSNSAAGPAFPLTFPVDGWVYSTNYYKTDRSAAGCPLTSTASAPLSDTRQVSLQMGACLPSVSDQKSIIYACANNGANFGGWQYNGLTCDKSKLVATVFFETSCYAGTSTVCSSNPSSLPGVPSLGLYSCSRQTGVIDTSQAILIEQGCVGNTSVSIKCNDGKVTQEKYANGDCTGAVLGSQTALGDGSCDRSTGAAFNCNLGAKYELNSSAAHAHTAGWSTVVIAAVAIVLGSRVL